MKISRSFFSCFSRVMVVVILLLTVAGCRDRTAIPDPADSFTPSGDEQVRELGIYAGKNRVGDLRLGRMKGDWQGTGQRSPTLFLPA